MAERIGLDAILDMANFNGGAAEYLRAVKKMETESATVGQRVGKSFDAVGKGILAASAIAATAAVAVTAAIGAFVVDGVKQAASLDEGMARIAATLNLTKDAVTPLKDAIISLGLDPKLKVTADEAALAIESLAKNGLNMDQILAGAARTTVLLANATGADFGVAADITTDTMAIFNMKADEMGKAINGIVGVTNASKFTIDDYRLALSQAGGVASGAGVEFDDFNTTIAVISPLFASGSDAGTSFKTMLQNGLIPQSKKAVGAMRDVGLYTGLTKEEFDKTQEKIVKYTGQLAKLDPTSKNFAKQSTELSDKIKILKDSLVGGQNAFYDSNGSLKSMNEIAILLQDALGGLSEEEQNRTLKTMFGTDASRAALAIMESGNVIYKTATEAAAALGITVEEAAKAAQGGVTQFEAMQLQIAKIDAEEQAATRMDNLKGKVEILRGQIDTLKLSIGDKLLPVLGDLTKWASEFVATHSKSVIDFFGNMVKGIGDTVAKIQEGQPFFDALTGGLQTGFGENGRIVGENIAAIAKSVNDFYTAVTTILQPLTDAIAGFVSWKDVLVILAGSVAFVVIPAIVSMVAAVAAIAIPIAAAVLAVAALRTAWETDFLGLRTKVTEALDAVSLRFADLTAAIATHGAGALQEIVAFATGNETNWTNVKAIWTEASTAGGKLFTDLQGYVTSNLPGWQSKLTEWGAAASEWITNAQVLVTAKLGEWWIVLQGWVTDNLPAWRAKLAEWEAVAWQWIDNAKVLATAKLGEWWAVLTGWVDADLPLWQAKLTEWKDAALQWVTDSIPLVTTKLGEWWTNISGWADTNLPLWQAKLTEWATAAWQWIVDASAPAVAKLGEWWVSLKAGLDTQLGLWKLALAGWMNAAWEWLVPAAARAGEQIVTWFTQLKSDLAAKIPEWKAAFLVWTNAAWQWIVDSTPTVTAKINEWYSALKARLDTQLGLWKLAFVTWANATWDRLPGAALRAGQEVIAWFGRMKGYLAEKIPQWKDEFLLWADATWAWLGPAAIAAGLAIGTWFTSLTTDLGKKIPDWIVAALKFATGLVSWVTSKEADAIPHLGTWFGKSSHGLGLLLLGWATKC